MYNTYNTVAEGLHFSAFIEVAIMNANIMYLASPCTGRRLTHKEFRIQLVKELLMSTAEGEDDNHGHHPTPNSPFRLTGWHLPASLSSLFLADLLNQTVAGRRGTGASSPPTSANNVICQCVWSHVFNCITQKVVLSIICNSLYLLLMSYGE